MSAADAGKNAGEIKRLLVRRILLLLPGCELSDGNSRFRGSVSNANEENAPRQKINLAKQIEL